MYMFSPSRDMLYLIHTRLVQDSKQLFAFEGQQYYLYIRDSPGLSCQRGGGVPRRCALRTPTTKLDIHSAIYIHIIRISENKKVWKTPPPP